MGGLIAYDLAGARPEAFAEHRSHRPGLQERHEVPAAASTSGSTLFGLFDAQDDGRRALHLGHGHPRRRLSPGDGRLARRDPGRQPAAAERVSCRSRPGPAGWPGDLTVPVLFLVPGDDRLVDERAGRRLFAKIALADKTLIEYPDMLHALSIDVGRDKVFADIAAWAGPRA
ncbi:MAG: lysophospholipase [Anaerotruncus sp.]|nr:lysophospholipase [Anaerotruncus sp.]